MSKKRKRNDYFLASSFGRSLIFFRSGASPLTSTLIFRCWSFFNCSGSYSFVESRLLMMSLWLTARRDSGGVAFNHCGC